jgi:hypothetical protein
MRWPQRKAHNLAPRPGGESPGLVQVETRIGRTGAARADQGGVADSGVRFGDTTIYNNSRINIFDSGPITDSSAYLDLVQDRFFVNLRDRDAELPELARFCVSPDGPDYTWWQADAYAGKSSLMAHLVLHPPQGARIIAFFVTARFAG